MHIGRPPILLHTSACSAAYPTHFLASRNPYAEVLCNLWLCSTPEVSQSRYRSEVLSRDARNGSSQPKKASELLLRDPGSPRAPNQATPQATKTRPSLFRECCTGGSKRQAHRVLPLPQAITGQAATKQNQAKRDPCRKATMQCNTHAPGTP